MRIKDFTGKQCLVTGAASGIGRSAALAASACGAQLFLTDINGEKLEETAVIVTRNGGSVRSWKKMDISRYDEVKDFADSIHAEFGSMDIVMNIAGIAVWGVVELLRHEDWQKVININLMGPIHIIECFVPPMVRAGKGGHLVNVSSAAGLLALPLHAPYSASKSGLLGISEVLRYDLMHHDIGVTVVCPGAVETPLKQTLEIAGIDTEHAEVKKLKKRFSNRAISPDRVASMIIKAIRKNRFMVITSNDIRLMYWFKRKLYVVYHLIMKILSAMMIKVINNAHI